MKNLRIAGVPPPKYKAKALLLGNRVWYKTYSHELTNYFIRRPAYWAMLGTWVTSIYDTTGRRLDMTPPPLLVLHASNVNIFRSVRHVT
jgi:hypothetical protein